MEQVGASPMSAPAIDVLVLAAPRDAQLTAQLLARHGFPCRRCQSDDELLQQLSPAAGAVVLAEERLNSSLLARLSAVVAAQPPWSDLPIVLVTNESSEHVPLRVLAPLGNVAMLRRPMDTLSLVSTVAAALRARRRQFEVRDLLQQLREQSDRKDQFLAMLAHELRNPLAPIRYAAHLLQSGAAPPERQGQLATLVDRQVGHMGHIIDQLLDVSRLTRGLIRLERRRVSLSAIAREAAGAHATAAAAKRISIEVDARDDAWVDGDPTRLRQVVDNLVDNSLKFSPAASVVRLRLETDASTVRLIVVDDGDGIEQDLQPFLFEAFVQADRSLARSPGGLGLGLALVKGIVTIHGGHVRADSPGAGCGSTFTVELPASAAQSSDASEPTPAATPAGRDVLIAEDNVDAAEALQMILEGQGYRVHVVHNGHAAVEALGSLRPDALVCDIGLPGLSGYDVARAASRTFRPRAMVAVTGYASTQDKADALAAGFDVHLPKPIAIETLLETLSTGLAAEPALPVAP